MTPQEPQQDASTMLYRLNFLEQQFKQLHDQLNAYVPVREHDLQLQNIQTTVSRIERDVVDMKVKQEAMEKESRERDERQRESQAAIQIRVLIGFASVVVTIVAGIITGYITHFFR
jgi:hypothetical protein